MKVRLLLYFCFTLVYAESLNLTEETEDRLSKLLKEVSLAERPLKSPTPATNPPCGGDFKGKNCDIPNCYNGARYSKVYNKCVCSNDNYQGTHCKTPICQQGNLNAITAKCDCLRSFYGPFCTEKCVNGEWHEIEQKCRCFEGHALPNCDHCEAGLQGPSCQPRRYHTYRSRFALAAATLSFITVILIWMSIVVKRRRGMLLARLQQERIAVVGSSSQNGPPPGMVPETPTGAPYPLFYPYPMHDGLPSSATALVAGPPPSYEEALRTGRPMPPIPKPDT